MPRGFKRAIADTEEAYRTGRLIDSKRRSFISQPKAIPGECGGEVRAHLVLWGADRTAARMKLFQRENNRCQKCKLIVVWGEEDYEWASLGTAGEWSHIRDKAGQKCDCPENAALLCHRCHQGPGSEHYKRRPQFGVKVPAGLVGG